MSVKITDNTAHLESDLTVKASIFLRLAAEAITVASYPKTPKKTGRMRNDVLKQVLGLNAKVVWTKNYAIYQEEKQFKNYTTPGTGPHYARNAVHQIVSNATQVARQAGLI